MQFAVGALDGGAQFVQADGVLRGLHQRLHLLLTHVQVVALELQVAQFLRQVGKFFFLCFGGESEPLVLLYEFDDGIAPLVDGLGGCLQLLGRGEEALLVSGEVVVLASLCGQFQRVVERHHTLGGFLGGCASLQKELVNLGYHVGFVLCGQRVAIGFQILGTLL